MSAQQEATPEIRPETADEKIIINGIIVDGDIGVMIKGDCSKVDSANGKKLMLKLVQYSDGNFLVFSAPKDPFKNDSQPSYGAINIVVNNGPFHSECIVDGVRYVDGVRQYSPGERERLKQEYEEELKVYEEKGKTGWILDGVSIQLATIICRGGARLCLVPQRPEGGSIKITIKDTMKIHISGNSTVSVSNMFFKAIMVNIDGDGSFKPINLFTTVANINIIGSGDVSRVTDDSKGLEITDNCIMNITGSGRISGIKIKGLCCANITGSGHIVGTRDRDSYLMKNVTGTGCVDIHKTCTV